MKLAIIGREQCSRCQKVLLLLEERKIEYEFYNYDLIDKENIQNALKIIEDETGNKPKMLPICFEDSTENGIRYFTYREISEFLTETGFH